MSWSTEHRRKKVASPPNERPRKHRKADAKDLVRRDGVPYLTHDGVAYGTVEKVACGKFAAYLGEDVDGAFVRRQVARWGYLPSCNPEGYWGCESSALWALRNAKLKGGRQTLAIVEDIA